MYYKTNYSSPIGLITMVADQENLIGLWIEGQKYFCDSINDSKKVVNLPIFKQTKKWLDDYFDLKKPDLKKLKLAPIGGEFRQKVWQILCEIPYGKVVTYKDIAKTIAQDYNKKSMSAQAIGGAIGHNPISIIIPCHRVVGTNNSLTGYAGGIDKKMKLLKHEGIDISKYKIPKKETHCN